MNRGTGIKQLSYGEGFENISNISKTKSRLNKGETVITETIPFRLDHEMNNLTQQSSLNTNFKQLDKRMQDPIQLNLKNEAAREFSIRK